MFDMPVLAIQLGDILVYVRRNEIQKWDCTPSPATEIEIKFKFYKPDFGEKSTRVCKKETQPLQ